MSTRLRTLFVFAVLLCCSLRLSAQVLYGSLVGQANDASGAAVPGATVTLTNKATAQARTATTNEGGQYTFVAVQPGEYDVKISKEGFRSSNETGVTVTSNNVTRVDVTMQVGAVSDSVTVEASTAVLQTDSATVKAEVTSKELLNVPVPVGRNYQNLLVTIPGFSPPQNAHSVPTNPSRALQSNVNGTSTSGVNVRIDGASSQQPWLPHIAAYVPTLEAIETVNVVTNSFSAEQGLAGGASINVQVKSGTNDFHGSGFWYHNNNALLAKPFTYTINNQGNQRNPKYIFNQPGGTIGGPIVKNKLFFFTSYEAATRREFANNSGTLPVAAMRTGNLSEGPSIYGTRGVVFDPATGNQATGADRTPFPGNIIPDARISQVAKGILAKMPAISETGFRENNYFATGGFLFDRHTVDSKVNYNVSEKWSMYARYGAVKYNMSNPGILGELGGVGVSSAGGNTGTANGTTHSLTYATTYVIKPNLILDANFGYTYYQTKVAQDFLDTNIGLDVLKIPGTNGKRKFEGGWPRFGVNGFLNLGLQDSFMPYERRDPQYQYVTNLNWTKGSHQIRFGIDFYQQALRHQQAEFAGQNQGAQGGFQFNGGPTQIRGGASASPFNSWGAFLLGLPTNYGTTYSVDEFYGAKTWMYQAFIQDTWQVNKKLTVNYGARYNNFPMPRRPDGRGMERYDFVNNKMLVCGLGSVPVDCGTKNSNLLFSPSLGISYRPTEKTVIRTGFGINWDPFNLVRALRTNYPILLILNGDTTDAFVPVSRVEQGIPIPVVPNISSGVLDLPRNYAVQSTGDSYRRSYIMSWNFTVQRQLPGNFLIQAGYVANRAVRQTNFLNANAGQIPGAGSAGQPLVSRFNKNVSTAIVDSLGHSKYDSLQTTLSRRFSSGLSTTVSYTYSGARGVCCNADQAGGPAISARDYLNLNQARMPFDRPHNFQATWSYELPFGKGKSFATSGFAAALLSGWQVNGLFSRYSGSPFTVNADGASLNMPGGNTQMADVVGEIKQLGGAGRGQAFYDWTAFRAVTGARFGNAGINTLRGPGISNMDAGLFRRFNVNERVNIQFRAEALNVSNTPQWANPSSNISSLRTAPDGRFQGGVFEITGVANTGRDGLAQRAFRLGMRIGF